MVASASASDPSLLNAAIDLIEEATLIVARDEGLLFSNRAALDMFGDPAEKADFHAWELACGFHCASLSEKHPGQLCTMEELPWNRVFRGEELVKAAYFLRNTRHPSGLWVTVNGRGLAGRDKIGSQAVISVRDVSTRYRAERALRAARRLNRALFEENQAPILQSTLDGRILSCNQAFARMLGYDTIQEVCALPATALHASGDRRSIIEALTAAGSLTAQEIEFPRKDGSCGISIVNMQIVEPGPGETEPSIISTSVDITAHRRAELARTQAERRFREFMRYLPGVAFIKDAQGRYLFFSESAFEMMGVSAGEIIGRNDDEIWPGTYAEAWRKNDHEVLALGKAARLTEDVPIRDTVHRWTIFKFPIPDEFGQQVLIGGIGVDEHERLELEARLRQVEKMDAIGRLAGGVAHDFNNLLTVISGYGQMLQDAITREQPAEKLRGYLEELLGASERATKLTDQLLSFSRRKQVRLTRLDLRDQVRAIERMIAPVIGEHIDLQVHVSAEPCFIRADSGQIEQMLLNLAVNARDTMPQGGRLGISVGPADEIPKGLPGGDFVRLEIGDSGVTIDETTRSRLFEPFFSAKPKGRGTGLGLSMVYGIVKQFGGEISVRSPQTGGNVFDIFFPICPPDIASGDKSAGGIKSPAQIARGQETILVVEDDETVRNLVKTMLERYGYQPLVADGGKSAIDLFHQNRARIKLLLTDVVMPQMGGKELAVTLKGTDPSLRVLYMSGYTEQEIATHGLRDSKTDLLQKPFNAETLVQRVRSILDAPAR